MITSMTEVRNYVSRKLEESSVERRKCSSALDTAGVSYWSGAQDAYLETLRLIDSGGSNVNNS